MSKIKLTGENSGYVEISAGQNAGNNTLETPTSGTRLVAHGGSQDVTLNSNLTVSGNVSVGGTLTYEDVTNIDAVGVVTARAGVKIPDNQKIFLGTGDDLEIYHDGNNRIRNSSNLIIEKTDGEDMASFVVDGAVNLFHNGTKKFETTSTGVKVTGDSVFGANSKAKLFENGTQSGVQATSSTSSAHLMTHDGNEDIHVDPSGYIKFEVAGSERLRITSNGNVGINSTTPHRQLVVGDGGDISCLGPNGGIYFGTSTGGFRNNGAIARAQQAGYHVSGSQVGDLVMAPEADKDLIISSGSTNTMYERIRVTTGGNIGINKSNPTQKLYVGGNIMIQESGILYFDATSGYSPRLTNSVSSNDLSIFTNNIERLRIANNGNIGVGGLTNPGALLSIPAGESNTPRLAIESAVDDNDFTITQYEDGNGTYTMLGQNVKLNSGGNNTILDSGHRTAGILLDARNHGAITFLTGGTNTVLEPVKITSAGHIGVNNNNPQGIIDVTSNVTTHGLGVVLRKDFNGPVANTDSKLALTLWGQDHDDAITGSGTDQFGPMIGFGARNDDGAPNTGDIRAAISYSYNGDLVFHAKAGSPGVADGQFERLRIDGASGSLLHKGNNSSTIDNTDGDGQASSGYPAGGATFNKNLSVNNNAGGFGQCMNMISHTKSITLNGSTNHPMVTIFNREGCFIGHVYAGYSTSGDGAVVMYKFHTFYSANYLTAEISPQSRSSDTISVSVDSVGDAHTFRVNGNGYSGDVTIGLTFLSAGVAGSSAHYGVRYY